MKLDRELGMLVHVYNSGPWDGEFKTSLSYIARLPSQLVSFLAKKIDDLVKHPPMAHVLQFSLEHKAVGK